MSKEEDQMRRKNAQVLALPQLQNRLRLYSGREEAESAKRVRPDYNAGSFEWLANTWLTAAFPLASAKYIEGLENRLGRMESLLRLSGLLSEDDGGKIDLGTLERRLVDRSIANGTNAMRDAHKPSASDISQPATSHSTPHGGPQATPQKLGTSPEQQKDSETEVETLSDMMCSLVTNNCGETRYIGRATRFLFLGVLGLTVSSRFVVGILDLLPERHSMGQ